MKSRKLKINISKEIGSVSALLLLPKDAKALMVLSHGAGAPMTHTFMEDLAIALAHQGIASLRFNFAYMERGGGPDRPKKAHPAIISAVNKALKYTDGLPLLAGGKSFGGRMTSQVAALGELPDVKGMVYYGFPLHAPGKASMDRAASPCGHQDSTIVFTRHKRQPRQYGNDETSVQRIKKGKTNCHRGWRPLIQNA